MLWNPQNHPDEDNLRWCWLRAIEWGNWPLFLSQTFAPVLLIWFSWKAVVIGLFTVNLFWAIFVRYNVVIPPLADMGVYFVLARWIAWPVATITLFINGTSPERWIALAWPAITYALCIFTPGKIGRIQMQFMRTMGYEPTPENPLSRIYSSEG
jgi:hypothetical protein